MGAGEVVGGMVDVYGKRKEPVRVPFDQDEINRLLGTEISKEEMIEYFRKIGLEYDDEANEVIAPTFRHDLFRMADLAEDRQTARRRRSSAPSRPSRAPVRPAS